MAADLHIHVMEGIEESDLAEFFANTLGSKYFNPVPGFNADIASRVGRTPNCWVGEVSWLKANLTEDVDRYVPGVVMAVSDVIGEELPAIDDDLIAKIEAAFDAGNATQYRVAEKGEVVRFLKQHRGKRAFTVSW